MKRRWPFILCCFLIFCNVAYAQGLLPFENQEFYFMAYYDDLRSPPFVFSFFDNIFHIDIPELDTDKIEDMQFIKGNIKERYQIRSKNGFIYLYTNSKEYLVLYDASKVCILIDCSNKDAFFGLNKNSKNVYRGETVWETFIGIKGDAGNLHLETSSFLTEVIGGKKIEYDGKVENYYYQLTKPWVEGQKGNGIGEWIQKRVGGNTDEIVFFNGYIDPNRPDLYYANSRVKELLITAGSQSWTFQIEDTSNPQILNIGNPVTGDMRFTIKDIYEGDKYSDVCIAGIYFLLVKGQ